ncbi:hypothetical protein [Nocardia sp. CS682]|uniref:hypothetical protein n=1 Tax=Nocardia sp. CS682 TaxID=1047172 RepID=UPI001074DCC5|nr:hypothetical protein [Nocardia sp. CS682]
MKRIQKFMTTGAALAATALVSVAMAGTAQSSVAPGSAALPGAVNVGTAIAFEAEQGAPRFEFVVTHYVVRSCYFENMDRVGADGPHKFEGKGKSKDAAISDADDKANDAAAKKGMKLKHCRTQSHTSKR